MKRALIGAVLAVCSTALLSGVAAPASAVAGDLLQVSGDGITFTDAPGLTMFDDIGRVVPGDEHTETAWVRSSSPERGRLRVDLYDMATDDAALADALDVTLAVDGDEVGRVTIGDATGACLLVSDSTFLDPRQTVRLDATVSVAPELGQRPEQDGMAGTLGEVGFRMRATLSDATVPAASPDVCTLVEEPVPTPTHTTGPLSITGSTPPFVALGIGAVGLSVGALLAARRTRRKEGSA